MSVYYEKARELGQLILKSDEALAYNLATKELAEDRASTEKIKKQREAEIEYDVLVNKTFDILRFTVGRNVGFDSCEGCQSCKCENHDS